MKEIDELIDKAVDLGLKEVERIARTELTKNKKLSNFTMAMGVYFFKNKKGEIEHDYECEELDNFIAKYSDLRLTGCPMMFTATGRIITDW